MDLINKKVTIIGGKRSGEALARLVVSQYGKAKISEQSKEDSFSENFHTWAKFNNVSIEFNGHTKEFIEDSDYVVLSPGVRSDSQVVKWAKDNGILVLGEIEFAYQFGSKPIIAVTGSNGKTTTATLIDLVLKKAGFKSCLCGNIGSPFSDYVLDKNFDYYVIEISSFQLESLLGFSNRPKGFKGFKPKIAAILNFTQNHLDRHKDIEEYFQAKKKIFLNQTKNDFAVLNAKDNYSQNFSSNISSKIVYFNNLTPEINPNQMAVIEIAKILGVDRNVCLEVFKNFKGVEHRLEKVRVLDGVTYINDSKSTTVEATIWALNNITNDILLICGGRDKNLNYSVIKNLIKNKVKKIFVIGEAQQKISSVFEDIAEINLCDSMENAIKNAKSKASRGDCILLSPMCASFDMFKNYEHRGEVFKEIVNGLL